MEIVQNVMNLTKTMAFAFIKLARPYFSLMPILPYLIGVGLARGEGVALDWSLVGYGLGVQILVQVSISFLNDYWDLETDALNQNRTLLSGGSGVLSSGSLPRWVGLATGCLLDGAAVLLALLLQISTASWGVLLAAIFAAHAYTMPPIKLVYRGMGELSAAGVAALLVPTWGYSLQTGRFSADLLLVALPLLPFIMGLLLGIATPDYEADQQVGKKTLVVLLGRGRVAALYGALLGMGYALAWLLLPAFLGTPTTLGVFASLPLALLGWWGLRNPIRHSTLGWFWMVAQTGFAALAVVTVLAIGVWA